jgi:hypothetical protein
MSGRRKSATVIQLRTVDFFGSELRYAGVSMYDYWRDLMDHVRSFGFDYSFACLWDEQGKAEENEQKEEEEAEAAEKEEKQHHCSNPTVCKKLGEHYKKQAPALACDGCGWFDAWAANVEKCIADGQNLFFAYLEEPLSNVQPQFQCTAPGYEGLYYVGGAQKVELEWLQNERGQLVSPLRVQDIVAPVMAIGVTKIAEEAKLLADLAASSGKPLDKETAKLLDCYKTVLQNYTESREGEVEKLPDVLKKGVMKLTTLVDVTVGCLATQANAIEAAIGPVPTRRRLTSSSQSQTPRSNASTPRSGRSSPPGGSLIVRTGKGSDGDMWGGHGAQARSEAKADHDKHPHANAHGDVPDLKYLLKQKGGDADATSPRSPKSPLNTEQPIDDGFGMQMHGGGASCGRQQKGSALSSSGVGLDGDLVGRSPVQAASDAIARGDHPGGLVRVGTRVLKTGAAGAAGGEDWEDGVDGYDDEARRNDPRWGVHRKGKRLVQTAKRTGVHPSGNASPLDPLLAPHGALSRQGSGLLNPSSPVALQVRTIPPF